MKFFVFLLISLGTPFTFQIHHPKQCTKPGPFCDTCSTLAGCVENHDGTFTKTLLEFCRPPHFCVRDKCTTAYDPFCWGIADWEFPCYDVGTFPDPFYCNKFVMCVETYHGLKHYKYYCGKGYGFNITTDLCDVELENGECKSGEYPVPLCKTVGQSGGLEEKPEMYYWCEKIQYNKTTSVFYPVLRLCPDGQRYVNYTCS